MSLVALAASVHVYDSCQKHLLNSAAICNPFRVLSRLWVARAHLPVCLVLQAGTTGLKNESYHRQGGGCEASETGYGRAKK